MTAASHARVFRRGGVHGRRAVRFEPSREGVGPGADVPRGRGETGHRRLVEIRHGGEGRQPDVAVGVEVHLHRVARRAAFCAACCCASSLARLVSSPAFRADLRPPPASSSSDPRNMGADATRLGRRCPDERGSVGRHLGLVLPRLGLAGPRACVRVAVLLRSEVRGGRARVRRGDAVDEGSRKRKVPQASSGGATDFFRVAGRGAPWRAACYRALRTRCRASWARPVRCARAASSACCSARSASRGCPGGARRATGPP